MLVDEKRNTSLSAQVKEAIVKELDAGISNENGRLLTMREIARRYDVSLMTVQRAISQLVDEGLLLCRRGRGIYVPESAKRTIAAAKSDITIGAVFLNIYSSKPSYFHSLWEGIGHQCHNDHINLQAFAVPEESIDAEAVPLLWNKLNKKEIEGLLLTSRLPAKDIVLLQEHHVPFVWLDNDFPFEDIHSILLDDSMAILLSINHLAAHNYKKVAIIDFWKEPTLISLFQNELAAHGMEVTPDFIKTGRVTSDEEEQDLAYEKMKELLRRPHRPQAVILGSEIIAHSAVLAIRDQGLKIPQDIAVIGSSHTRVPFYLPKETTFILYPTKEMGMLGISMLKDLIDGKDIEQPKLILNPSLIIGNSCGCSGPERTVSDFEEAKVVN